MKTLNLLLLVPPGMGHTQDSVADAVRHVNRVFRPRSVKWHCGHLTLGARFSLKTFIRRFEESRLCLLLADDSVPHPLTGEMLDAMRERLGRPSGPSLLCIYMTGGVPASELTDSPMARALKGYRWFCAGERDLDLCLLAAMTHCMTDDGIDCPLRMEQTYLKLDEQMLFNVAESRMLTRSAVYREHADRLDKADRKMRRAPENPDNVHACRDLEREGSRNAAALFTVLQAAASVTVRPLPDVLTQVLDAVAEGAFAWAYEQLQPRRIQKMKDALLAVRMARKGEEVPAPEVDLPTLFALARISVALERLAHPEVDEEEHLRRGNLMLKLLDFVLEGLQGGLLIYDVALPAEAYPGLLYLDELYTRAATLFKAMDKHPYALFAYIDARRRLARIHTAAKKDAAAEDIYEEVLRLARAAADKDQYGFQSVVAAVLAQYGMFHKQTRRTFEAETELSEALVIYRVLQAGNRAYNLRVARALSRLSDLVFERGDYNEAEAQVCEAVDLLSRLAEVDPPRYLPLTVEQLCHLSFIHYRMGLLDVARSDLMMAVDIYSSEGMLTSGGLQDLANLYSSYGYISAEMGRTLDAIEAYEIALRFYRGMALCDPSFQEPMNGIVEILKTLKKRLR